ncbi:hypothetical protein JYU04_00015 [Dehalococcoides mccartyi]|nr:hypothetical protein [Dehalococcoides mccartyi]
MAATTDNFLLRIRKYASIPENLLSEAFANLLTHIADSHPAEASRLLNRITDGALQVPDEQWELVDITTQISADANNYPDIEIKGSDFICWIEAKDGGDPEVDQLARYHNLLVARSEQNKALISLTRSRLLPVELPLLRPAVGWSQIAVWLSEAFWNGQNDLDPTVAHLKTEFLNYLGGIGMTVNKVGFELVSGLKQLENFRALIRECLELESGVNPHSVAATDAIRYYVPDPNGSMALVVLIKFENPEKLGFESVDRFLPAHIELPDDWTRPWKGAHKKDLNLADESVYFFSRSVASQAALVRGFIRECLDETGHVRGERPEAALATTESDDSIANSGN